MKTLLLCQDVFNIYYIVDIAYLLYKDSFRTSQRTPVFSVRCELNITTVQDLSTLVFSVTHNFYIFSLFEPKCIRPAETLWALQKLRTSTTTTKTTTLKGTHCCGSVVTMVTSFVLGGVSCGIVIETHAGLVRFCCTILAKFHLYWLFWSQCVYWYYWYCYMPTDMAKL